MVDDAGSLLEYFLAENSLRQIRQFILLSDVSGSIIYDIKVQKIMCLVGKMNA